MGKYIDTQVNITSSNIDDMDDDIIKRAHHIRQISAFGFFEEYIHKEYPILDVGCRDGGFMEIFRDKGCIEVIGIDCSEKAIEIAQNRGLSCIVGDIHDNLEFDDEFFGTILMSHILEHCYDVEKVLNEIFRILMDDGIVLVEIPIEKKPDIIPTKWGHYSFFEKPVDLNKIFQYNGRFELVASIVDKIKNKWYRGVFKK